MKLPNIWGQGCLFTYSGLNGVNEFTNSLVTTLLSDRIGVQLNTKVRRLFYASPERLRDVEFEVVSSDLIKAQVKIGEGRIEDTLTFIFYNQTTIIAIMPLEVEPVIICEGNVDCEAIDKSRFDNGQYVSRVLTQVGKGETTILIDKVIGKKRYAILTYGLEDKEKVLSKALEIANDRKLDSKCQELIEEKIDFYNGIPIPKDMDDETERTLSKCFSVMKSQVYTPEGKFKRRYTTPDRFPHKQLWLWDSVFHSFGNRFIDKELAYDSILAIFDTQHKNGFIPHTAMPHKEASKVTQPPVIAWGIHHLYEKYQDIWLLEEAYEALKAYLQWNIKHRDSSGNHLFEWYVEVDSVHCRCDECGMDNSPRFDDVKLMKCIDFSCFMANEAKYMSLIAKEIGKTEDIEYWNGLYQSISEKINELLWDEKDKMYYDLNLENNQLRKVKAVSSFLPLFAGVCSEERAKELVQHLMNPREFGTEFPIPSIAVSDDLYGTDMWRGPVWINYNYMIMKGLEKYGYHELADDIQRKTIEILVYWYQQDGTIYEFYDSGNNNSPKKLYRKGKAIEPYDPRMRYQNIRDYGWSCTLLAELIMERYS